MNNNIDKINKIVEENYIPADKYKKYDVKRGLRDADGKGVLVGLTKISEVHGYLVDEGEKIPHEGRLLYRGISVVDLVRGFQEEERYGFEEFTYLAMVGKLPNKEELEWVNEELKKYRIFEEIDILNDIRTYKTTDVMNGLQRAILSLYSIDNDPDNTTLEHVLNQSFSLIARTPILLAHVYGSYLKETEGYDFKVKKPKKEYSTSENILYLIREDGEFTKEEAEILDLSLVIHGEHGGGNNSSFTNYVISSSGTDTYSTISAAIGALKGPKHGGANAKVLEMIQYIMEELGDDYSKESVRKVLTKILNKEAFDKKGLIYGMGHAIYTISDPRAVLFKEKAKELAQKSGIEYIFDLFETIELESKSLFKELKGSSFEICANVDFYSGFVYSMLKIPKEIFTPLFASARMVGWCAHRLEQLVNDNKIVRPAYKSIYNKNKFYEKLSER